jgi:hypothetical protein
MTIQQAEQLIRDYQRVLPQGADKGSRRNPALLPAEKEQLIKAIKLEIAQLYYINSTGDEHLTPLIHAAMLIDSFNDIPFPPAEFIESMHRRRKEIESFHLEVMKLDRTDPFYWQRVFTMLGISSDTRKTSFLAGIREKLRFGHRQAAEEQTTVFGSRPLERLSVD